MTFSFVMVACALLCLAALYLFLDARVKKIEKSFLMAAERLGEIDYA